MKMDKTGIALIWLAAAMMALGAVVATIVINDLTGCMPLGSQWITSREAASQSYEAQSRAVVEVTALLVASTLVSAAMLLGFVLLRVWIREGRPAEGGNERFFA